MILRVFLCSFEPYHEDGQDEMIQPDRSSSYVVAEPRMLRMRLLSTRRAGAATRGHVALGKSQKSKF